MQNEICNKCGREVEQSKKLDGIVWECPNCGLEEYQSRCTQFNGLCTYRLL